MQGPNVTVLNPPLPEPLNFLRIAKFEPFGVPKSKFNGFESSPAWNHWIFQNHQIWTIWGAKVAKSNGVFWILPCLNPWIFSESPNLSHLGCQSALNLTVLNHPLPEPLNFLRIAKFEPFGVPKCAKFNSFESSPAWTFEFSQNRQIWAIWGAKVAKFNGFESSPAWTFEFSQNRQIHGVWAPACIAAWLKDRPCKVWERRRGDTMTWDLSNM